MNIENRIDDIITLEQSDSDCIISAECNDVGTIGDFTFFIQVKADRLPYDDTRTEYRIHYPECLTQAEWLEIRQYIFRIYSDIDGNQYDLTYIKGDK